MTAWQAILVIPACIAGLIAAGFVVGLCFPRDMWLVLWHRNRPAPADPTPLEDRHLLGQPDPDVWAVDWDDGKGEAG